MLTRLMALILIASVPAWADGLEPAPTPVMSPVPTATPVTSFKDSKAQVTPDPSFQVPGFAERYPHVSLNEAKRLHAMKDVVFADGRNYSEWQHSHIPGAVSLPVGEFDARYAKVAKKLKKAHVIVAYCHGENCRLADHLAQQLVGKGFSNVAVFAGGFPAWSNTGLPLTDEKGKLLPTPTFQATPKP